MTHNSPEYVASMLPKMDADKFDKDVFDVTGLFIIRNAVPKELMQEWLDEWNAFYDAKLKNGRDVNLANPVALKEPLPEKLANIYKNEKVLDHVAQLFGNDLALYHSRFVIKDKFSPGEVFVHHDFCYHTGYPDKASFFIPLTYAGKKNGGLTYYLGTHKYGCLGDAGEINPDFFTDKWPELTPELQPGDIAVMSSLLWHKSGVNEIGQDRVVADIIYQPANDPSSIELLRGDWKTDFFINRDVDIKTYFKSSRVTKMMGLYQKVKELEEALAKEKEKA